MIPEEEARQLVVDTLYPFYSLLGVNKSKRSTTARDVCMDFMVFIQTAGGDDTRPIVKKLLNTKFTSKVVEAILLVAPLGEADGYISDPDDDRWTLPVYWTLLPLLSIISDLFARRFQATPGAFTPEINVLQGAIQKLVPVWFRDKGFFHVFSGEGWKVILNLREHMHTLLRDAHAYIGDSRCKVRPDDLQSFVNDSLSIILRLRLSIPLGSGITAPPRFFKENTIVLQSYLITLHNILGTRMSIDISQWARCQHQDIVSYFLGVAADPEKYQTDPFEELSTLGLLIIYDSSPGLSQALIEADYLTHSILHARVKLPSLRPSTQLVRIAFRDLIGSWHFMLERSESQPIYLELSKKMLDLDVLFIVEAFVVMKLDAGSTLDLNTSNALVSGIQQAFAAGKSLFALKYASQIAVIASRANADPLAHPKAKDMWRRFAEEQGARFFSDEVSPPELICGLPGCSSLASAELQCRRCKQCYCSVACQKPDWHRHKTICRAL